MHQFAIPEQCLLIDNLMIDSARGGRLSERRLSRVIPRSYKLMQFADALQMSVNWHKKIIGEA